MVATSILILVSLCFTIVSKDKKNPKPKQLFSTTLISVFYTDFLDNKWSAFSPPLTAFVMQVPKDHTLSIVETEEITKLKKTMVRSLTKLI